MARGQRIHRLPQRLDYTLIPAPLDLTLPLVDEKSPLPAIIVTPSSPRGMTDFSIAFLAPAPKPTITQRVSSLFHKLLPCSPIGLPSRPKQSTLSLSASFKARMIVILFLLLMVLGCHLITHRMAIQRPHMKFENPGLGLGDHSTNGDQTPGPRFLGDRLEVWEVEEEPHDFVVTERLKDDSLVPAEANGTY